MPAAAGGDRSAWDRLVDEYSGLVWSVIRGCGLFGAEAADVSQTVWLRFVEHIDRLREAERAGAWLATTARHECFRVLRRSGRQVVTAEVPEVAAPDGADAVVEALAAAAERGAVLLALGRIPPRCQELLRLIAWEDLSHAEAAAVLGISVNALTIRLHRARARFEAALVKGSGGWRTWPWVKGSPSRRPSREEP